MTIFKHKTQDIQIGYSEYIKLSASEKEDFMIINTPQSNVTNNIKNETTDLFGVGKVAETVVLAPIAIAVGIFSILD